MPHRERGTNELWPAVARRSTMIEMANISAEVAAGVRRHILVVDDCADSAEVMGELVKSMGHDVLVARTGPGALALLHDKPIDVAFLDIALEGVSGYELAGMIRAQQPQRCRLVAVTGFSQLEDRVAAAEAGFDAFIVKPVRMDQIATEIDLARSSSSTGPLDVIVNRGP